MTVKVNSNAGTAPESAGAELEGALPSLSLLTAAAAISSDSDLKFSSELSRFRREGRNNPIGFAQAAATDAVHLGQNAIEIAKKPEVQELAKSVGKSLLNSAKDWALDMALHPQKLIPIAWGFVKGAMDGLGLTDIGLGALSLGKAAFHVATFNFDAAGRDLKDSGRLVKGAATAVLELTGLADCGRAIKCLKEGNYAGAAFYGAMGIGQIAALAVTFGGANLLANGTKVAAREGFEVMAKETGEAVVREVGEKITSTELKAVGAQIAEQGGKKLMEIAQEKGAAAVTENVTREVLRDVSEAGTRALLEKHGVKDIVERCTLESLKQIAGSSRKELVEHLITRGMSEEAAAASAKAMQKVLGKAGQRAIFDAGIKDIFVDAITKDLKDDLLKRGMAEGFKEAWEKEAIKLAQKGIEKEMLVRAGTEGFEEGVERGVRKVVREGVESAFRKFRTKLKFKGEGAEADETELKLSAGEDRKGVEYGSLRENSRKSAQDKSRFAWKKNVHEKRLKLNDTNWGTEDVLREKNEFD